MKRAFMWAVAALGLLRLPSAGAEADPLAIDPDRRRQASEDLATCLRAFLPGPETVGVQPSAGAEADPLAIDPDRRRQAIEGLATFLRAFQPGPETVRVQAAINEASKRRGAVYRVRSAGLVETGTNGWVYLVLHSSHQDPAVGDVTLAIDQRGRVFQAPGHVCGTVAHFVSAEKRAAEDPDDFFRRFLPDAGAGSWTPLAE